MPDKALKRPRFGLGAKLSALSCVLVLGVLAAMSRMVLEQAKDAYLAEMRLRAEFFSRMTREAMFPKVDAFQLHFLLQEMLQVPGIAYAAILDEDGRILSHSDKERIGERDESPEGRAARRSDLPVLEQRYGGGEGVSRFFDLSAPVRVRDRRLGTVRIGITGESLREALAPQRRDILAITVAALAGAILGTVLLVSWMTRAIPRVAAAAARLGAGDLSARVDWRSRDEIGFLAESFNRMADDNQGLIDRIVEEKLKVETAFSEMKEGAVLLGEGGEVLLINEAARGLLDLGAKSPGSFAACFEGFEGVPGLEELKRERTRWHECDVVRRKPKLLILALTVGELVLPKGSSGWLAVFRDVTEERREDSIAKELLTLMSHKFKTPLTVVLGYLDLLKSSGANLNDAQKKALDKMIEQEAHVADMVNKMLQFASVEEPGSLALRRESVPAAALVEGAIEKKNEFLGERGASVEAAASGAPPVDADRGYAEAALANLIENAAKFNDKPEPAIRVEAAPAAGGAAVRLSVLDDGPGIPPEERGKLFRKFHQVEDHFTGQVKGLGLGLAYAKAVADAHGGSVGFEPREGGGSRFWIELPAAKAGAGGGDGAAAKTAAGGGGSGPGAPESGAA